ncbi:FAD-binding oxidoreductase [Salaquimonas pukyongi]|uniref:FAD-binding oxidoreductase n=1 Tax=Salaquimonas pukyongi TaxID=2712698 RepID=UPI00096BC976|nr:FAD-binding oxidoreductase [Salaquimonas pukyongi]
MARPPEPQILARFADIVGEANTLTAGDDLTRYTHENRNIVVGKTPLVLKPANTQEVAGILKLANETKTAIVPQGGHTGHVAGAVPDESGSQIVLSLERMNTIREVDAAGNTMTVEAGVILQKIQEMADAHDRLFPLSLAAEGSCQIGGNISTNAGGTGVLAYGNTRALVLGLEVVTARGEIWNGLKKLKKDNTGYDLKDLFIGAEGTLGVVTAAVVKLYAKPKGRAAAWAGLNTPQQALDLLNMALERAGGSLTAFEFMPRIGVDAVFDHYPQVRNPLDLRHDWQVLLEVSSNRSQQEAEGELEALLAAALEAGTINDAAVSASESQRLSFWAIREIMPESQKHIGASIKHDISVAVHRIPEFIERAAPIVEAILPGARSFPFGHMGDGNIHYNVSQPAQMEAKRFLGERERIQDAVHALVLEMDGSISAEHGIGRLKRELLAKTKDPAALAMMRAIKQALDPNGIMNPGKVL